MEGFISGFVGTLLTHPLEVLRLRRQVENRNFLNGISVLSKGIILNANIYGLHYFIYFKVYNELKNKTNMSTFSSGFIAQGISSVVLNPLWIIRTKKMALGLTYSSILNSAIYTISTNQNTIIDIYV
jgi:hypothetical protein